MTTTKRRVEILQGIARGGVLFQSGWLSSWRGRWRDNGKRERHCCFHRASAVNSRHARVTVGLIEKMVACGLIEKFKPHVGVPCYRLTSLGHDVVERATGGLGRYPLDTFKMPGQLADSGV